MVLPTTVPGVTDRRAAELLQPRWTRARRALSTALVACPWAIVASCVIAAVVAGATGGSAAWSGVAAVGAAVPAVVLSVGARKLLFHPPRWVRSAVLGCGAQVLLGVLPAVGAAASAGGAGAAVATAVLVLALVAAVVAVSSASRAMRTLLTPVSWELGATPFTVAVRARLHDPGMLTGSVSVGTRGVEWAARRHRAVGQGGVPFDTIRDARPTMLPDTAGPTPWLSLSDGSTAYLTPGPAVLLDTGSGTVTLPVDDPQLFVALLHARVAAWRSDAVR
ncbi:hypothetical protein ACWGRK_08950 [Saccharomonospora azurea]